MYRAVCWSLSLPVRGAAAAPAVKMARLIAELTALLLVLPQALLAALWAELPALLKARQAFAEPSGEAFALDLKLA